MSNILWSIPIHNPSRVVRAAAILAGYPLELPKNYEHQVDNKQPEFLSKFPHGKIPGLEQADGFKLFEAIAITHYIASKYPNSGLLGHTPEDAALILQWIHLSDSELDVYSNLIQQLVFGMITPYNKPIHNVFVERQIRTLRTLDAHLSKRTFFVGERITIADLVIASNVRRAATISFDAPLRAELPHVLRHSETVIRQPKFEGIWSPVEYVEKPIQYVPPPKEKKEPKPAPAAAPKAEKKKEVEKEDDEEDEPAPAPKVKNPLDDLPKSTFNLEDWKRQYSNNETRGASGSLEWFYNNFDKEGFSVWRFDFKYNEELTLTFMSANQLSGFYNRLEASRKYLFASAGVLGENNKSVITGALILRGQDFKPVMEVAPDWESYEFKKLDLSKEEDKNFFEAALAWDLEVDGKKWVDGKLFK